MEFKKILSLLNCKWLYIRRKMYVYRPTYTRISRDADIAITKSFGMNVSYDFRRQPFPAKLIIEKRAKLRVNHFNAYNGCRIEVFSGASLEIGSGFINYNSTIECYDSITIGENVKISENVVIRDSDGHTILRENYKMNAPIVIEDDVWIGLNCVILKGVTIGKGAIIAAGSVVTKSIPPHCLAGGVPARIIKTDVTYK